MTRKKSVGFLSFFVTNSHFSTWIGGFFASFFPQKPHRSDHSTFLQKGFAGLMPTFPIRKVRSVKIFWTQPKNHKIPTLSVTPYYTHVGVPKRKFPEKNASFDLGVLEGSHLKWDILQGSIMTQSECLSVIPPIGPLLKRGLLTLVFRSWYAQYCKL